MTIDLERLERIEAIIARLEANYRAATNRETRDSIGSAIDAWNGVWRDVRYPRGLREGVRNVGS